MKSYFLELKERMNGYKNNENKLDLILKDFSSISEDVEEISEKDFWILLDIFDEFSEISEFGINKFVYDLIVDSEGWPYNDSLLLRPTKEQSVMAIKGFALDDGAEVLESRCVPSDKTFNSNIENYWKKIDWSKASIEERKLILKIIGSRDPFSEPLKINTENYKLLLKNISESDFWLYSFSPVDRLLLEG